jgi:hypothetical protein
LRRAEAATFHDPHKQAQQLQVDVVKLTEHHITPDKVRLTNLIFLQCIRRRILPPLPPVRCSSWLVFKLCFPALLLSVVIQAQAEDKALNLYSWADYVPAQTLQRFEQETGIHVRYDTFDTSEVLETKLLTGGSGYDVVVPSSSVLARGLAAGALKEIPHGASRATPTLIPICWKTRRRSR